MALQDIAELYREIEEDPKLSERLDKNADSLVRELMAIGEERGYELVESEIHALLKESPSGQELTDEDLEQVAGGASWGSGSVTQNKIGAALESFGDFGSGGTFIQTDTFPR